MGASDFTNFTSSELRQDANSLQSFAGKLDGIANEMSKLQEEQIPIRFSAYIRDSSDGIEKFVAEAESCWRKQKLKRVSAPQISTEPIRSKAT